MFVGAAHSKQVFCEQFLTQSHFFKVVKYMSIHRLTYIMFRHFGYIYKIRKKVFRVPSLATRQNVICEQAFEQLNGTNNEE